MLPVLWTGLELYPSETERPLKKTKFFDLMGDTETIVSPSVLRRMWTRLTRSRFANPSPYFDAVLVLDVRAIRNALIDMGLSSICHHAEQKRTSTQTAGKVIL